MLPKGHTYYLSGPMTGLPKFNIPAFEYATSYLRSEGYTIISPAELDSSETRGAGLASVGGQLDEEGKVGGVSYGEMLGRDVRIVIDNAQGMIFLPGWWTSKGARIEAYTALITGKKRFAMFFSRGTYDVNIDQLHQLDTLHTMPVESVWATLLRFAPSGGTV